MKVIYNVRVHIPLDWNSFQRELHMCNEVYGIYRRMSLRVGDSVTIDLIELTDTERVYELSIIRRDEEK